MYSCVRVCVKPSVIIKGPLCIGCFPLLIANIKQNKKESARGIQSILLPRQKQAAEGKKKLFEQALSFFELVSLPMLVFNKDNQGWMVQHPDPHYNLSIEKQVNQTSDR